MKYAKFFPYLIFALAVSVRANGQSAAPTFKQFIEQFPKASLPYSIGTEALQAQLEKSAAQKPVRLSWEYYQFLPELDRSAAYSNMPVHPEPVAAFETERYTAVLYNLARGRSRSAKSYSISVYTKEGRYVGTHFVAGVNACSLTSVTIDEMLAADVNEYKVLWGSNNSAAENKITGLNMVETGRFPLTFAGNPDQILWNTLNSGTTAVFTPAR
jgi:hypothetical protein